MVRLNIIVEGQTEETFVRDTLAPHLAHHSVVVAVRCVETSKRRGRAYRGGLSRYEKPKRDIQRWTLEQQGADVRFTTMFDLYGLPTGFPDYQQASQQTDPYDRVKLLESALADDIDDWRFIPYVQLHEFEALLFANPSRFSVFFMDSDQQISQLEVIASDTNNPELIDDGSETAPSRRIISHIPEYAHSKAVAGPQIARAITLDVMRQKCPHFNEWLTRLEQLDA